MRENGYVFADHWSDVPPHEWTWPNFSPEEMACRATGKIKVSVELMDKLQALRTRCGKPLIVLSAYRTQEHNKAVGGASNSQHTLGKAADISLANHEPRTLEVQARLAGFSGIGRYPKNNFLHVDTGPHREWGENFPKDARVFSPEAPRVPETIMESTPAKAGSAAGASIVGLGALDQLKTTLEPFQDLTPYVRYVLLGIAAVSLLVIVVKELKAHSQRSGK
jgi:hypothetical protein